MNHRWMLVVVAAACGGKKDKPDCEAYAGSIADIARGAKATRAEALRAIALDACQRDLVPISVANCISAARTYTDATRGYAEAVHCQDRGMSSDSTVKTALDDSAPPSRIARKGFSVGLPAGWRENKKTEPNELFMAGNGVDGVLISRVPGAAQGLASDDECRSAQQRATASVGSLLDSAQLVTTRLGRDCRSVAHDRRMKIQSDAIPAGRDEALVVSCFYDLARSSPPAFCDQILGDIKLD